MDKKEKRRTIFTQEILADHSRYQTTRFRLGCIALYHLFFPLETVVLPSHLKFFNYSNSDSPKYLFKIFSLLVYLDTNQPLSVCRQRKSAASSPTICYRLDRFRLSSRACSSCRSKAVDLDRRLFYCTRDLHRF